MSALLLLLLGLAPGLFWLWYFYQRDHLEPEPRGLVLRVFALGVASCIPLALLEMPIPGPYDAILAAPIIEELGKFLVVYLYVYRHHEFNEPMDGIVYGVAAALGFATIENLFYVLEHGAGVGVARALLSVPGHALWAALWGYALGQAKFRQEPGGTRLVIGALLLAMLSHALFNFGCSGGVTLLLLVPPVIIVLGWLVVNRQLREALLMAPWRRLVAPPPPPPRPPRQIPPVPPPPPSAGV